MSEVGKGMLLTVDVGNTNTVLGLFEGSELKIHWRLTTRREQTVDEYGILVRNLLSGSGYAPEHITAIALASVVPPLTPVLVTLARQYLDREPLVVEPGVKTGMPILYEPPGDVGADRILNGVAAFDAYGGPVVVVDCRSKVSGFGYSRSSRPAAPVTSATRAPFGIVTPCTVTSFNATRPWNWDGAS